MMTHRCLFLLFVSTLVIGLALVACSPLAGSNPSGTIDLPSQGSAPAGSTTPPAIERALEPLQFIDGLGRTVTLQPPLQRVLSLAPSNTEILFAIGAAEQVVGRDSFSDYPSIAAQIPDVGGGFAELNTELILSLQPDLVLAAMLTPPEQVRALEKLGVPIFVLPNPLDFNGLYINLLLVAQMTGHEAQARILIKEIKERASAIEAKLASVAERPLVFYELDGTDPNAPWTPGPGTFIDTLITMAGGLNVGAGLQGEWVQISIEELIKQDPDIILIGDATWGGVTPEALAARTGWESLTAVKDGQLFPFDDNLVSRPGPRLVEGLEALAELLHPQLFP